VHVISPELLRRYNYFTAGGEAALEAVTRFAELVELESDDILINEGDPAGTLYVIIEGALEVEARLGDGTNEVVDTLVAGDLAGWSSIFEGRVFTATVAAQTETRLLALDADKLRDVCAANSELGYNLMSEIAKAVGSRLSGARLRLAACHKSH
jgi:CRP-like cAMP-binding protein